MSSKAEGDTATIALRQGQAWLERGKARMAVAHFERALALAPALTEAYRYLAYALVYQGEFKAAAESLAAASGAAMHDPEIHNELGLLREIAGYPCKSPKLHANPKGKLRFASGHSGSHHRSGWRYAMNSLDPLHNPEGILFESFLEAPFAWDHPRPGVRPPPALLSALRSKEYETRITSEERRIIPYKEPWVGFMHNPPNMPEWFHPQESPQAICAKPVWQESLKHCLGLFTLSEYAGDWLRKATGKPVSVVMHPTEIPEILFSFERFLANPGKQIVQIGWWLRRLTAIDRLPISRINPLGYKKLRLVPGFFSNAAGHIATLRKQEFLREGAPRSEYSANTGVCEHLSNDDYDQLLAENIVFVDLHDASANNAVIECLARATPILVNRLPAVEEYLGAGYPLYFDDLSDAAVQALDVGRLRAAHEYLLACETRHRLDGDYFRRNVENSEVYQSL